MSYRQEFKYSIPGLITGGIIGAPIGTVIGYQIWRAVPDTETNVVEIIGLLAIPTLLVTGATLGAYIGGRIFGKRYEK